MPATYQLKITLDDICPPIWRRVRLSGDSTLADLHDVIQISMGWEDYHLHMFRIGERNFMHPDQDVQTIEQLPCSSTSPQCWNTCATIRSSAHSPPATSPSNTCARSAPDL